jgi:hypothetical protein
VGNSHNDLRTRNRPTDGWTVRPRPDTLITFFDAP